MLTNQPPCLIRCRRLTRSSKTVDNQFLGKTERPTIFSLVLRHQTNGHLHCCQGPQTRSGNPVAQDITNSADGADQTAPCCGPGRPRERGYESRVANKDSKPTGGTSRSRFTWRALGGWEKVNSSRRTRICCAHDPDSAENMWSTKSHSGFEPGRCQGKRRVQSRIATGACNSIRRISRAQCHGGTTEGGGGGWARYINLFCGDDLCPVSTTQHVCLLLGSSP